MIDLKLILYIICLYICIVQGGYRAVIFDRVQGVKQTSSGEGTHFLVPWLQRAVLFDVRTKPRNISTTTGSKGNVYFFLRVLSVLYIYVYLQTYTHTHTYTTIYTEHSNNNIWAYVGYIIIIDMQMVSLTLRVLHRPDIKQLPAIYQNLGLDYDERVLPSIGNEVLKAIVAQFDASELITQREVISARIREELYKRARDFNIALEDVSIVSGFYLFIVILDGYIIWMEI